MSTDFVQGDFCESQDTRGVFVESAFSVEDVDRAVVEEVGVGRRMGECAFLGQTAVDFGSK